MADSTKASKLGGSSGPLVSKLAIAKLSEDIIQSAANRRAFVANPGLYLKEKYGYELNDADLSYVERLQQLVADGFCCGGCFCMPADLGDQVINPALAQG